MATSYKGQISGSFAGFTDTPVWNPSLATNKNSGAVGQRNAVTLSAGNNTITVPAGATICLMQPPSTSVNAKTLKGGNSDTGIPLDPATPMQLPIASGTGSFVINSGGTEVVEFIWV